MTPTAHLSESDTRSKLIDPALHARGWSEDLIRREETAGAVENVDGQPRKRTKGYPTERIWYYDLSHVKVGKKTPLTAAHFEEFFRLLPERADSEHSWNVTREEIEARGYDLKAVNPHAKKDEDTRTPAELLDLIEAKGQEVAEALRVLREH